MFWSNEIWFKGIWINKLNTENLTELNTAVVLVLPKRFNLNGLHHKISFTNFKVKGLNKTTNKIQPSCFNIPLLPLRPPKLFAEDPAGHFLSLLLDYWYQKSDAGYQNPAKFVTTKLDADWDGSWDDNKLMSFLTKKGLFIVALQLSALAFQLA